MLVTGAIYSRSIPVDRGSEQTGGSTKARFIVARLHPSAEAVGRSGGIRRIEHRAERSQLLREGWQGQE